MDSKVVSTLALLVGVLVTLYILTGDKDRVVAEETETVPIQETSEAPAASEDSRRRNRNETFRNENGTSSNGTNAKRKAVYQEERNFI